MSDSSLSVKDEITRKEIIDKLHQTEQFLVQYLTDKENTIELYSAVDQLKNSQSGLMNKIKIYTGAIAQKEEAASTSWKFKKRAKDEEFEAGIIYYRAPYDDDEETFSLQTAIMSPSNEKAFVPLEFSIKVPNKLAQGQALADFVESTEVKTQLINAANELLVSLKPSNAAEEGAVPGAPPEAPGAPPEAPGAPPEAPGAPPDAPGAPGVFSASSSGTAQDLKAAVTELRELLEKTPVSGKKAIKNEASDLIDKLDNLATQSLPEGEDSNKRRSSRKRNQKYDVTPRGVKNLLKENYGIDFLLKLKSFEQSMQQAYEIKDEAMIASLTEQFMKDVDETKASLAIALTSTAPQQIRIIEHLVPKSLAIPQKKTLDFQKEFPDIVPMLETMRDITAYELAFPPDSLKPDSDKKKIYLTSEVKEGKPITTIDYYNFFEGKWEKIETTKILLKSIPTTKESIDRKQVEVLDFLIKEGILPSGNSENRISPLPKIDSLELALNLKQLAEQLEPFQSLLKEAADNPGKLTPQETIDLQEKIAILSKQGDQNLTNFQGKISLARAYAHEIINDKGEVQVAKILATIKTDAIKAFNRYSKVVAPVVESKPEKTFEFVLSPTLPDKPEEIEPGKFYISHDGDYVVHDLQMGDLKESGITIGDLASQIKEPAFKTAVLKILNPSKEKGAEKVEFAQVSTLPNLEDAEPGKFYISSDGSYLVHDVQKGTLKSSSIDLNDLDKKIKDTLFMSSVLEMTGLTTESEEKEKKEKEAKKKETPPSPLWKLELESINFTPDSSLSFLVDFDDNKIDVAHKTLMLTKLVDNENVLTRKEIHTRLQQQQKEPTSGKLAMPLPNLILLGVASGYISVKSVYLTIGTLPKITINDTPERFNRMLNMIKEVGTQSKITALQQLNPDELKAYLQYYFSLNDPSTTPSINASTIAHNYYVELVAHKADKEKTKVDNKKNPIMSPKAYQEKLEREKKEKEEKERKKKEAAAQEAAIMAQQQLVENEMKAVSAEGQSPIQVLEGAAHLSIDAASLAAAMTEGLQNPKASVAQRTMLFGRRTSINSITEGAAQLSHEKIKESVERVKKALQTGASEKDKKVAADQLDGLASQLTDLQQEKERAEFLLELAKKTFQEKPNLTATDYGVIFKKFATEAQSRDEYTTLCTHFSSNLKGPAATGFTMHMKKPENNFDQLKTVTMHLKPTS
jgi:hypothetical protein